jgi:hypothetical protein
MKEKRKKAFLEVLALPKHGILFSFLFSHSSFSAAWMPLFYGKSRRLLVGFCMQKPNPKNQQGNKQQRPQGR